MVACKGGEKSLAFRVTFNNLLDIPESIHKVEFIVTEPRIREVSHFLKLMEFAPSSGEIL